MWDSKSSSHPPPYQRQLYYLALFATWLTLVVVILGAYTRLTDAGLGCPDWPGCYGQITPISIPGMNVDSVASKKAWTEMVHRYGAGLLGLIIFAINVFAIRNQRFPDQPLALPLSLAASVIFQAALGMWTVTLKLYPLVVVAHLLGGLTSLSLVWWLSLRLKPIRIPKPSLSPSKLKSLRIFAGIGLSILIIQLFLGGWTSANYAALVCLDFPYCQAGQFFPDSPGSATKPFHFLSAFNLVTAGVTDGFGSPLDIQGRIVIHMVHRFWAAITAIVLGGLAIQIFRSIPSQFFKCLSLLIITLLILQLILGVTNILAVLPLPIAISHHAVAALLLLVLVTLNYTLSSCSPYSQQLQCPQL